MKFGADPEVFATYKKDGKSFVIPPAYLSKYMGLKCEPDDRHPKFLVQDGITIHQDGAAFEFTLPPANTISELLQSIHHGYDLLQNVVLKGLPEYQVEIIPTVNYEIERWMGYREDQDFFTSLMFGCDPHQLAWNPDKEDEPVDASVHPYRYAGGHEHFSGMPILYDNPILAIRSLDLTVGLAATAFSPVPELENLRTFRYGQAGVYRPQVYSNGEVGIEYRSISNSWTNPQNKELASQFEKWTRIATEILMVNVEKAEELITKYRKEMLEAISTSNQTLALSILNNVEGEL